MYKITDLSADATVVISLTHKTDKDNEYFTKWDLYTGEMDIYSELEEHSFDNVPTEDQVKEVATQLFEDYVNTVMFSNCVSSMNMTIVNDNDEEYEYFYSNKKYDYEGKEKARNEGMLILDDLKWGVIDDISIQIDDYEIEEIN